MKNLTLLMFLPFVFALPAPVAVAFAHSCSLSSGPMLHRDTLPDCSFLDSLELLDTSSPVLDAGMDYGHLYGLNNDRLSDPATVNGKQDLAAALDPVFLQALGADTYRSETRPRRRATSKYDRQPDPQRSAVRGDPLRHLSGIA